MKKLKADNLIKIIASICFCLIAVALIMIYKSPAVGYEPSIYEATPTIAWACLIIGIACGIGIIVQQAMKKDSSSNSWLLGLSLIIISNAIILSLHILKGYEMWAPMGDPGTHLGLIQETIANGSIENIYPVTHIYLAELALILNIDPLVLYKWIPVFFGLLSMGFMYFLAKALLPSKGHVLIATIAGTILIQGWYLNLTPNHLANLLFPFTLFLFVKSFTPGSAAWRFLFIITLFLMTLFHPVPSFALIIFLLTIWIPGMIIKTVMRNKSEFKYDYFHLKSGASLFLVVWWITWLSSFWIWSKIITNINYLITEGGPLAIDKLLGNITAGQEYGYSIIEQFFKIYGGITVFLILTIVALFFLWKRPSKESDSIKLLALFGPIIAIGLLVIALYLSNLGFGPTRFLIYAIIPCSILVGFIIYEFIKWSVSRTKWISRVTAIGVISLFLVLSVNQISIIYPSPYVVNYSYQTTKEELNGLDWFFNSREEPSYYWTWRIRVEQYADFMLGIDDVFTSPTDSSPVPDSWTDNPSNLGYDNYTIVGKSFKYDSYLLINEMGKRLNSMFPTIPLFNVTESALSNLGSDPTLDKLYSSGNFDVYYVHSYG